MNLISTIRSLLTKSAPTMTHKVGWHLGNTIPFDAGQRSVIRAVPPKATIHITGEHVAEDELRWILDVSPGCHIFFRPYFAPSERPGDYQSYIETVASLIDQPTWDFIPVGQRHLQIFNEQNMPRHSQWEGFGTTVADMVRFNTWFCNGYKLLKRVNPTWNIGYTPLTPGNRDVYFKGDQENVPYYMHGPEAAKENPHWLDINVAIRNGPCHEALSLADEYYAHIYVINDVENQIKELCYGLRFVQYAKFFPKPMDIWITECGIGGVSQNWTKWYQMLSSYPIVMGTCIWILGHIIRSDGDLTVQELKRYVESLPNDPPLILEEHLRDVAWNASGIAYNPNAAFPIYARDHGLGAPVRGELDTIIEGITYRLQGFVGAIVYAKVDDWANIEHIDW